MSWQWRMMQNLKRDWHDVSKLTWGIWRILIRALESLKKIHFNVLLLSKVYIVLVEKVQRSYLSWHWRGIQNLERNRLAFQNWHKEFNKFWPEHSKVSKISTLMGSFWAKYILFELKKYRGIIFHHIEEWCKIWRKTDLWFGKWHEGFGKFSAEHSKVSKLELWWDPFVQSRKCMSFLFTEELCVMAMKNDTKIEEELTCLFKTDMRNFTNFDPSTKKSKKIVF